MRPGFISLAAAVVAAALISSIAVMPVRKAAAQEVRPAQPPCSCSLPQEAPRASPRPKFADHSQGLDDTDEIATLDAIRVALSEVGDGSTYVWHSQNGRLSGVIQPTASFKDAAGRVCRHIVLVLTTGVRSGRVEGVACRLADGRWQLEG
jgi:hypothetical protein